MLNCNCKLLLNQLRSSVVKIERTFTLYEYENMKMKHCRRRFNCITKPFKNVALNVIWRIKNTGTQFF